MTDAHEQRTTIHIVYRYPDHEPREDDPHYHLFEHYKTELKRLGRWHCVVPNCVSVSQVELHHSHVEYAVQGSMDRMSVASVFGLPIFIDEEAFLVWIESPGNLEPLCKDHHTGLTGVHVLPEPAWNAVRCQRSDLPPVAEVEFPSHEVRHSKEDSGR